MIQYLKKYTLSIKRTSVISPQYSKFSSTIWPPQQTMLLWLMCGSGRQPVPGAGAHPGPPNVHRHIGRRAPRLHILLSLINFNLVLLVCKSQNYCVIFYEVVSWNFSLHRSYKAPRFQMGYVFSIILSIYSYRLMWYFYYPLLAWVSTRGKGSATKMFHKIRIPIGC